MSDLLPSGKIRRRYSRRADGWRQEQRVIDLRTDDGHGQSLLSREGPDDGWYVVESFDNIDHHRLMERVRARVTDGKLTRLIGQFLRAGVLSDGFLLPTNKGTPQGGVISPLLANVALGVIEERYEQWTHHRRKIQSRRKSDAITAAMWARMTDRKAGRAVSRFDMLTTSWFSSRALASKPNKKRTSWRGTCTRPCVWNCRSTRHRLSI
jgi:Reverse transcriptase (RNA-dependent DNA polymerase)